jgi:hypothetical protein
MWEIIPPSVSLMNGGDGSEASEISLAVSKDEKPWQRQKPL